MTPEISNYSTDEIPTYLREVLEEAKEWAEEEPEMDASSIAWDVATNHRGLITNRGQRDNFDVLQDLRDLDSLSVEDLEMNRKAAPSYDDAEATIEAIVTSSLETFIYDFLVNHLEHDAESAGEEVA